VRGEGHCRWEKHLGQRSRTRNCLAGCKWLEPVGLGLWGWMGVEVGRCQLASCKVPFVPDLTLKVMGSQGKFPAGEGDILQAWVLKNITSPQEMAQGAPERAPKGVQN
jgi:hypothetical protein